MNEREKEQHIYHNENVANTRVQYITSTHIQTVYNVQQCSYSATSTLCIHYRTKSIAVSFNVHIAPILQSMHIHFIHQTKFQNKCEC